MRIELATASDLPDVQSAYAAGRELQRAQGFAVWPEFIEASILDEIDSARLYRVLDDDALAGVFSVAYSDEVIWGARETGAHIYLHRIARAATYARGGLITSVLAWAREHARTLGLAGLRMDTWSENAPLIAYYERMGFTVVERRRIEPDPRLPPHYYGIELALMEERSTASAPNLR